jgi:ParB/RepB/Spo0J family partition protein
MSKRRKTNGAGEALDTSHQGQAAPARRQQECDEIFAEYDKHPPGDRPKPAARAHLVMVPIASIAAGGNVRAKPDEPFLVGLQTSISELGMLEPIILRKMPDGPFRVVAGFQRLEAARRAGEEMIEAKLYSGAGIDDAWEAAARLAENVQRRDLSHMELAGIFGAAVKAGMAPAQIAAAANVSDDMVRRHLSLLRLTGPVAELAESGRLPVQHAEIIARVGDTAKQIELAEHCLRMEWSPGKKKWTEQSWRPLGVAHEDPVDYVAPLEELRADVARAMRGLAACGWLRIERESARTDGIQIASAGKPPCEGCPDNTATHAGEPALFAGIHPRGSDKRGFCSNPGCYEAKTAAWEKFRQRRKAAEEKRLKSKIAQARKAGAEICQECGAAAELVKTRDGRELCGKCRAKAEHPHSRRGESWETREERVAAIKRKFPWEPEQRFALGTYKWAGTVSEAIGGAISAGTINDDPDVPEVLLALKLRPLTRQDWFEPRELAGMPTPMQIGAGKHFSGADLAKIWKKLGRLDPDDRPSIHYDGEARNVPLPQDALEGIALLERLARAWQVWPRLAPKPREEDFRQPAEKKPATPIGNGKGKPDAAGRRACLLCGCTEDAACPGGCSWFDPQKTICNRCADLIRGGQRPVAEPLIAKAPLWLLEHIVTTGKLHGDWRRSRISQRIQKVLKAPPEAH